MFTHFARNVARFLEQAAHPTLSIPANMPLELLVLVERVVRPLPVSMERRKRLRSDFLDHLHAIHVEELARDQDATAAIARTQQRFGDPAELTAELRRTIRWTDTGKFWLERLWAQRPAESALLYVGRLVGGMAVCLSVAIGLLMADHHFFGTQPFTATQLMIASSVVAFLSIWVGSFLLFGLSAGKEWEQPRRSWGRIISCSLMLIASWPLSLMLLMFLAGGSWVDYSIPLASSVLGGMFSVVTGTAVGILHNRDMRYLGEWAQLDLDAA